MFQNGILDLSDNEFNEAVSSIESFMRDSFNKELLKIVIKIVMYFY